MGEVGNEGHIGDFLVEDEMSKWISKTDFKVSQQQTDILKKMLDHYHRTYPQGRYRIAPQEGEYIRVENLYEKLENDGEISSSKEEGKYNGLKKQLRQLSEKGYCEVRDGTKLARITEAGIYYCYEFSTSPSEEVLIKPCMNVSEKVARQAIRNAVKRVYKEEFQEIETRSDLEQAARKLRDNLGIRVDAHHAAKEGATQVIQDCITVYMENNVINEELELIDQVAKILKEAADLKDAIEKAQSICTIDSKGKAVTSKHRKKTAFTDKEQVHS